MSFSQGGQRGGGGRCQGTSYFASHFQPLQPPHQYFFQHSSLHPSTLQIPSITSLWHNSNASACPLLTPTSWPYDFTTHPFSLHLFTFSYLFLCRYISVMTLLPLLLHQLSPFISYLGLSVLFPFFPYHAIWLFNLIPLLFYSFIISVHSIFST